MADPVAWTIVERGWAVVASDGSEVGKVDKVLGEPEADIFDGLAAGAGTVLGRAVYVPSEQVGAIEEGTVHPAGDFSRPSVVSVTVRASW